jgi:pimeloyl-ACP methyl ester carboxylesterase
MRRFLVVLVPALLAAALVPSTASAAVAWAPCTDRGFQAFECGRLAVPVDRAGGSAGTVELFARRLRAPGTPTGTALVALAGGPGQPAAPIAASFATALAPGLRDRDLLVFDQRGTGQSGALACRSLERRGTGTQRVGGCAQELGARRGFYRTSDSVADLEELRREAGYERLALFGVSYGTKVALDYAAAHPDRVERLVLDSVVPQEGPDPLGRSSFVAARRILREQCGAGRCTGVTPDPVGDVRRLVTRSRRVRGSYTDGRGRRRTAEADGGAVYLAYRLTDLNPAFRGLLPGAVRAAVRGDETPLLRVLSQVIGGAGGSQARLQADADGVNTALNLATVCEEVRFPWDRAAGTDARAEQASTALAATPASVFAPFDRRTAAASSLVSLCLGWPNATPAPDAPRPLPGVPTLELTGAADIRTPVEDARAVAARIPSAPSVVAVPHVGHSVLSGDPSGCARAAIAEFFRTSAASACPPSRPVVPPMPRPAPSLGALRPTGRVPGLAGRTLTAALRTRDDAIVAALGAQLDGRTRVGGVRGGTIRVRGNDVILRDVQWVRGVRVSGTFAENASTARVRITGSGARGTLTFRRDGRVTGRLGGRTIRIRPVGRAATATGARTPDWTGYSRFAKRAPLARAAR